MITLYGNGHSRSFRALWALEEINTSYIYKHVDLGLSIEGKALSDDYLLLNSQGKVPTLTDNNLVITESAAILNYIAALEPLSSFVPENNPSLKAKYDQICFFVLSELEQPLWTSGKHRFALPEEIRVLKILDIVHWEFEQAINGLSHIMDTEAYAVGNQFTMADILVAHTLQWAENFLFDVPDEFQIYQKRMYERPACKRALKKLLDEENA